MRKIKFSVSKKIRAKYEKMLTQNEPYFVTSDYYPGDKFIIEEYALISEKKSKLPRSIREKIIAHYKRITGEGNEKANV